MVRRNLYNPFAINLLNDGDTEVSTMSMFSFDEEDTVDEGLEETPVDLVDKSKESLDEEEK